LSLFVLKIPRYYDALPSRADTLWITDAGIICAAQLIASGVRHIRQADQWPADAPAYGQWCKLDL